MYEHTVFTSFSTLSIPSPTHMLPLGFLTSSSLAIVIHTYPHSPPTDTHTHTCLYIQSA